MDILCDRRKVIITVILSSFLSALICNGCCYNTLEDGFHENPQFYTIF